MKLYYLIGITKENVDYRNKFWLKDTFYFIVVICDWISLTFILNYLARVIKNVQNIP